MMSHTSRNASPWRHLRSKQPIKLSLKQLQRRPSLGLICVVLSLALNACDPDGKKKCAWVLEPEPKLIGTTEESMIPVCARNRETFKEDCRLQASVAYAKQVYGRMFRYIDLRVKSTGIPRTVATIRFCDGKGD